MEATADERLRQAELHYAQVLPRYYLGVKKLTAADSAAARYKN